MWLKASDEWTASTEHTTLIKRRPSCERVSFSRMAPRSSAVQSVQSVHAGRGPYCCDGECPIGARQWLRRERECDLPAAAAAGLPSCARLKGGAYLTQI
eukprot:2729420-Pleurochrysis_carterae.AAC.1